MFVLCGFQCFRLRHLPPAGVGLWIEEVFKSEETGEKRGVLSSPNIENHNRVSFDKSFNNSMTILHWILAEFQSNNLLTRYHWIFRATPFTNLINRGYPLRAGILRLNRFVKNIIRNRLSI